jgi:ketosteroid isomerase-like protein
MTARAAFERYKAEINHHDFDRVAPLIADDARFWFSSGTHHGLADIRAAFERTWGLIQDEVYAVSDEVWVTDDVCLYTFHWRGVIDGKPAEGRGRGTSCFRREADGWKIVHEHLSAFPR